MKAVITFVDGKLIKDVEDLKEILIVYPEGDPLRLESFEELHIDTRFTYHFKGSNTVITKGENILSVDLI